MSNEQARDIRDYHPEDWDRVAKHVNERVYDLDSPSYRELESTGTSSRTWRKIRSGEPIVREAKFRQIETRLNWEPGSIRKILNGGEPVLEDEPEDQLQRLTNEVSRLSGLIQNLISND